VEEVEEFVADIPVTLQDTYKKMLEDILREYPGERNYGIIQKMLIWLCQANYCLILPEFVAMVTFKQTEDGSRHRKCVPWNPESFCLRLGPFLRIDTGPNEINLPHSTMEAFLQGDSLQSSADSRLRGLYVSRDHAQKHLAERTVSFLGCTDFRVSLTQTSTNATNHEDAKFRGTNPLKAIPGALVYCLTLDPSTNPWILPMASRLQLHTGLEYAGINWHDHVRKAAQGTTHGDFVQNATWIKETLVPLLDWLLDEELQKTDGRYRSWQEVHAYFCWKSSTDCECDKWQPPRYFLEKYGLDFLIPYLKEVTTERDAAKGDYENTSDGLTCDDPREPTRKNSGVCLGCGTSMPNSRFPTLDDSVDAAETEEPNLSMEASVCDPCIERTIRDIEKDSMQPTKCGRTYELSQNPDLRWRVLLEARPYILRD
jgi:hypothetical protein